MALDGLRLLSTGAGVVDGEGESSLKRRRREPGC